MTTRSNAHGFTTNIWWVHNPQTTAAIMLQPAMCTSARFCDVYRRLKCITHWFVLDEMIEAVSSNYLRRINTTGSNCQLILTSFCSSQLAAIVFSMAICWRFNDYCITHRGNITMNIGTSIWGFFIGEYGSTKFDRCRRFNTPRSWHYRYTAPEADKTCWCRNAYPGALAEKGNSAAMPPIIASMHLSWRA